MRRCHLPPAASESEVDSDVASLIAIVGRVVRARVANATIAEDLIQETLMRVLAAADRLEDGMLEPYAIATARNVVASTWKRQDRDLRNRHRVVELTPEEPLDEGLLRGEARRAAHLHLWHAIRVFEASVAGGVGEGRGSRCRRRTRLRRRGSIRPAG